MWSMMNQILVAVDDFVWGVPLMILIMSGGVLLTVRLGLLQIRRLPLALKWMFKNEEGGSGEISSFAALCTALSATIGTGNIVGAGYVSEKEKCRRYRILNFTCCVPCGTS